MTLNPLAEIGPWYRQLWPWLLISGPLTVVVAAFITLWLAIKSDDGLVASDYYRRGLAINQNLSRTQAAEQHQLGAHFTLQSDGRGVQVVVSGNYAPSTQLRLRLVHPTRALADQETVLNRTQAGTYEGMLGEPVSGNRLVVLEDVERSWQVSTEVRVGADHAVTLGPR